VVDLYTQYTVASWRPRDELIRTLRHDAEAAAGEAAAAAAGRHALLFTSGSYSALPSLSPLLSMVAVAVPAVAVSSSSSLAVAVAAVFSLTWSM
jgi:hypothetical protein